MTRWQLFRQTLLLHLRRAPRDLRSLRVIGILFGLLAYLVYFFWSLFYLGIWGAISIACMLMLAYGLVLLFGITHRDTDKAMLKLSPASHSIDLSDIDDVAIKQLQQLLYKRAIFADRAGAEAMLRINVLPEHLFGACRRRVIDFARSAAIWDELSGSDQQLLLSPEGAWDQMETDQRCLWAEDVRALRWALKMDRILTPFEFTELDLRPVLEITSGQQKPGDSCLATWDIRPGRDEAHRVFVRGFSEGALRNIYRVEDDAVQTELVRYAQKQAGLSTDVLANSDTFAAVETDRVTSLARLAHRRETALQQALAILEGLPADITL